MANFWVSEKKYYSTQKLKVSDILARYKLSLRKIHEEKMKNMCKTNTEYKMGIT